MIARRAAGLPWPSDRLPPNRGIPRARRGGRVAISDKAGSPGGAPGARGRRRGRPDRHGDAVFCILVLAACLLCDVIGVVNYFGALQGVLDFAGRPVGRDFVNYWTGGKAVFDGMLPEIFDFDLYHPYQERLLGVAFADHNWSYPPHMLLLVWPLGLLPYLPGLALWSAATTAAYLWACGAGRRDRRAVVPALLLAPATYVCLTGGQNGLLTGALLIGGLKLTRRHPVLAGMLFGLLTVKPQLGLLLPFALLAARQWTAIASAGLTALALAGGSALLFGVDSWRAYLDLVVPLQTAIMNHGTGMFTTMMPSAYMGLRLLGVAQEARTAVQLLLFGLTLAGVLWTFARSRDDVLKLAVLAVGTFVASPYAFNYDMTTASLAVALLALRGLRAGFLPGERVVLAMTWLLPITIHWFNGNNAPVGPVVLLACFGYLIWRVRAEVRGRAPEAAPVRPPQPALDANR